MQARDSIAIANAREDFKLVDGGRTSLERVKNDPNISLYCLNSEDKSVAFVETQPGVDYHAAALSYQAQRNHAVAVHELSLEEFGLIASDIRLTGADVLLIFSVGRCGSTLLHHALNRSSRIRSLSEPDFISNVQQLGPDFTKQAKKDLLRDAARLLVLKSQARDRLFAIKLRSGDCGIWGLLDQAFDQPRSMFMYRNAVDTIQSYDRLFSIPGTQLHTWLLSLSARSRSFRRLYKKILLVRYKSRDRRKMIGSCEYSPEDLVLSIGPRGYYLLDWLRKVAAYLAACERSGNTVFALRFEDLVGQCEATIAQLFVKLGLPRDEAAGCCDALRRDAHDGTSLARASVPHRMHVRTVRAIEDAIRPITCMGGLPTRLPNTIQP